MVVALWVECLPGNQSVVVSKPIKGSCFFGQEMLP